jgi:hypothetical protein
MTRTLPLSLAILTLAACATDSEVSLDGTYAPDAKAASSEEDSRDTGHIEDTGDFGDTGRDESEELEQSADLNSEDDVDPDVGEKCNCIDDDGDGQVDEDMKCHYKVDLKVTADDGLVAFADGAGLGVNTDWTNISTYTTLMTAGTHHLAAKAFDMRAVQKGFLASVSINNVLQTDLVTGAGGWYGTVTAPASGWQTDLSTLGGTIDSDASMDASCSWGTYWPADLLADGADWVWPTDCADTTTDNQAWFVTEFEVCPEAVVPPEECNCEDDDGDGYVDEGLKCEYDVDVELTVDDYYEVYLDGSLLGSDNTWTDTESYSTVATTGTHLISVVAQDLYNSLVGFVANVEADGTDYPTGHGDWLATTSAPASGWMTSGLTGAVTDDSILASACSSSWGTWAIPNLDAVGAEWVWYKDCSSPSSNPDNYYQLEFDVCPAAGR